LPATDLGLAYSGVRKILGVINVVLTAYLVRRLFSYTSSVRGIQTLNVGSEIDPSGLFKDDVKRTSHKV
jgi:hypothetical protein